MEYKKNTPEYRCDGCGGMLVGYEKNVFVNKSYLCIKGKFTMQNYDEERDKRYFVHLIPLEREVVTVCDLECLAVYMRVQHNAYQKNREYSLRQMAAQDDFSAPPQTTHSA